MTSLRPPPVKIVYLGFQSSVLVNSKYVGTGYVSSGHVCPILRPHVTFQSRCDTYRVTAWCHQNPLASSPLVKIAYLGFPSSVLVNPKHVGPGYAIYRHICQVSVPVKIFQSHCDTPRTISLRHQNPLRPLNDLLQLQSKLYILAFQALFYSIQNM